MSLPPASAQPCHAENAAGGILSALRFLDNVLQRAIQAQQRIWSADSLNDRFRGLYVGYSEAEEWLHRQPGAPLLSSSEPFLPDEAAGSTLGVLGRTFSLTSLDMAVVVIALAPEIDLRYERIYAFLQDDVSRKRPSVDLALNLLCASAEEKLARRDRFSRDAPLIRKGIVRLLPIGDSPCPPLTAHGLKLDNRIVEFLLGSNTIEERLRTFCYLRTEPSEVPGDQSSPQRLCGTCPSLFHEETGMRLVQLWGGSPLQVEQFAFAMAAREGWSLLVSDLQGKSGQDIFEAVTTVHREALLQHAVPYFKGTDPHEWPRLSSALAEIDPPVIVAGGEFQPLLAERPGTVGIQLKPLTVEERRRCWDESLSRCKLLIQSEEVEFLARRYRLTPEKISASVQQANAMLSSSTVNTAAEAGHGDHGRQAADVLIQSAREIAGSDVAAVARKVPAIHTWSDLVLPDSTREQLHEFCARIVNSERVLSAWGFERKFSHARGTLALFVGPSGTGKTMAAEVIANEIGFDVYKVDLATVVSKYIGETEQNLDRIFKAAENASMLLFFDEADALFGKRSEVRDSHDRYANIEISYLLQKMEAYEGAAILATNLGQNMDEAFLRRFAFNIRFPFPEEAGRRQIWTGIWPPEVPLSQDIDFPFLARRFRLTGGNIRNVALAAAFLAADDGGRVSMEHVFHALEREFEKMGKSIDVNELTTELRLRPGRAEVS